MTVLQVCAFAAPNPGSFIASLTYLEKLLYEKGVRTIYAFSEEAAKHSWCQEMQARSKVYPQRKAAQPPRGEYCRYKNY